MGNDRFHGLGTDFKESGHGHREPLGTGFFSSEMDMEGICGLLFKGRISCFTRSYRLRDAQMSAYGLQAVLEPGGTQLGLSMPWFSVF